MVATIAYPSLSDAPLLEQLEPYFLIEPYSRDRGRRGARHRFYLLYDEMPALLLSRAFGLVVLCCKCREPIQPIRASKRRGRRLYIAVSCPLEQRLDCARSPTASREYETIEAEVLRLRAKNPKRAPRQGELFR